MKRISVATSAIIVGGVVVVQWKAGTNTLELIVSAILFALALFAIIHGTLFWRDDAHLQAVADRYGKDWYADPEKLTQALIFILGGLPGILRAMMPDLTAEKRYLWRQWTNHEVLNHLGIKPTSYVGTMMVLNVAVEKTIDDGAVTWTIKASLPTTGTDAFAKIVDRHVRNREWRGKAPA